MGDKRSSHAYRADVDGLRAVAILPVLAYHVGLEKLAPGGFVGVDVFFVISGFLITSILAREVDQRRFSVADFYARRVRRIFPALFVVFLACVLASFLLSFPSESANTADTMLASLGFSSNILFYTKDSYFSGLMERNPLLHTWSLSVEEQFYVFFPLLLIALRRTTQHARLLVLGLIALASLGISVWQVKVSPEAAFYLLPSRAWELTAGALLAVGAWPRPSLRWSTEILAFLGFSMIVLSVMLIGKTTPFPGITALGACLGATLLIYTGQPSVTDGSVTWMSRLLGWGPIRWVGLISYSLYLWHWPVMVFVRQQVGLDDKFTKLGVLAVSFVLASLSWWFVERPFRTKPYLLNRNQTLLAGLLAMLFMVGLALFLPIAHRTWRPMTLQAEDMLGFEDKPSSYNMRKGVCFLTSSNTDVKIYKDELCLKRTHEKPNILLIGDSHAAHLWSGLQEAHPEVNLMQATASGCRPTWPLRGQARCVDLLERILRDFVPTAGLDGIILSGRWKLEDVDGALRMVNRLKPYATFIVVSGPVREYRQALPRILAMGMNSGTNNLAAFAETYSVPGILKTEKAFSTFGWPENVMYFSAYEAVKNPVCDPFPAEDIPVQFDYGHLTHAGAVCVARQMKLPPINHP